MSRNRTEKKTNKGKVVIICIILVLIALGIIFIPKLIDTSDKLSGLWDVDGNTKYEFDGKGNGKIIVPGSEFEFSYNIKENVISIDFKNEESRDTTYEYNLSNEHLELKDLNQTNVNLKLTKIENK